MKCVLDHGIFKLLKQKLKYLYAMVYNDKKNNYILFLLFNILQIKVIKNYTVLIENITKIFSESWVIISSSATGTLFFE